MAGSGAPSDEWFYCLTCARAWPAKAFDDLDGACPSDVEHLEVHPHVRWSRVEAMLGIGVPTEGQTYPLPVPRNRSLVMAAEPSHRRPAHR